MLFLLSMICYFSMVIGGVTKYCYEKELDLLQGYAVQPTGFINEEVETQSS